MRHVFVLLFMIHIYGNFLFGQDKISVINLQNINFSDTLKIVKGNIENNLNNRNKLDPLLRIIYRDNQKFNTQLLKSNYVSHPLIPINFSGKGIRVPVLIKTKDLIGTEKLLQSENCTIWTVAGDIITAEVPVPSLDKISSLKEVTNIDASVLRHPLLDKSSVEIKADAVHTGLGLPKSFKGKNVIVGVVDSGIDWNHDNFTNTSGNRILYLWDMSENGHPPQGYDYGTEFTKSQLDINQCTEKDLDDGHGHGTHVTSTAAGNDNVQSGYTGVAPEADIVFVKGFKDRPSFADVDIINGCSYIFSKAEMLNEPSVINLSLGGHYGPHDGTSLYEQALSNLTGPGKIIVAAAGNEGSSTIHLSYSTQGSSPAQAQKTFWIINQNQSSSNIDLWYNPGNISIGVAAFDKSGNFIGRTEPVAPGETLNDLSFTVENITYGYVTIDAASTNDLNNGANRVLIGINSNYGQVDLSNVYWVLYTYGSGTFDAWVLNGGYFTRDSNPTSGIMPGDYEKTVGIPSTAKKVISVGAYVTKNRWIDIDGNIQVQWTYDPESLDNPLEAEVNRRSFFSSIGPTRDGRIAPDISAPGEAILAALSSTLTEGKGYSRSEILQTGKLKKMQGTSMACPHVTGLAALMLEVNSKLSYDDVLGILKTTARHDDYTGDLPNNRFGYGKIDALEAMKSVVSGTQAKFSVDLQQIKMSVIPESMCENSFNLSNIGEASLSYNITAELNGSSSSSLKSEAFLGKVPEQNEKNKLLSMADEALYLDDGNNYPDIFMGYGDGIDFQCANKFKVDGFNFDLKRIEFFGRSEQSSINSISYSIRNESFDILAMDYKQFDLNQTGQWFSIDLPEIQKFKNGESFYVYINTYLSSINYPFGFDLNAAVKNNSFYIQNDTLININTVSEYKDGAFLIRAVGTKSYTQNANPVAIAQVSKTNPSINEVVTFDASQSYDADGQIQAYLWEFGDGNTSSDKISSHAYANAGVFNYKLTVTDDKNAHSSTSSAIRVTSGLESKLTVEPGSGTLVPNETKNIKITFSSQGVKEGLYNGQIHISTNGGNVQIPLQIKVSSTIDVNPALELPKEFDISQNYPNPFNPITIINYQVPKIARVQIDVYDVIGRKVMNLIDDIKNPGYYNLKIDASNLSSGVYFYRIRSENYSSIKKFMIVK